MVAPALQIRVGRRCPESSARVWLAMAHSPDTSRVGAVSRPGTRKSPATLGRRQGLRGSVTGRARAVGMSVYRHHPLSTELVNVDPDTHCPNVFLNSVVPTNRNDHAVDGPWITGSYHGDV